MSARVLRWLLAVVAMVSIAATVSAQSTSQVMSSQPQAKVKGRPTLYIFSIQGCQPCKRLADEGLTDPEVEALINRMEYKKVDMALTKNARELYRTHARSGGVPELVLYDDEGKLIGRQSGFETIDTLLDFLRKAFSQDELAQIKSAGRAWNSRITNDNTN